MGESILVTGAAGFLGSYVVDHLLEDGHTVVALDDLSGGFRDNVNPNAVFVEGDIVNHELVGNLFRDYSFDRVFHLAAYAAEGLSHFIRRFNYTNNLLGSVNLINESVKHDVKCFVFTSSMAVYGSSDPPFHEGMRPTPEDPYGIAKYAVEQDLVTAHELFGLNYVIIRPHNVYGERQNIGDRYRNVIGIFMNRLMSGKECTVFGDGKQTRAFSYILDVTPHIARAGFMPEAFGEVFNIGGDVPYSINQLAKVVCKHMGVEEKVVHLPPRYEVKHAHTSHDKARDMLGFKSEWSLDEGISRMAEWAKNAGPRKSSFFSNIEIEKKLPKIWKEEI